MKTLVVSPKISIDKHKKINFHIDQDLSNFLNRLKVKIIPVVLKNNKLDLNSVKYADGLILAGGGDISKKQKNKVNQIRDSYEKKLFKYYYNRNKPILAICRGFQLIADIHGIKLEKINNHVRKFHSLKIDRSKFIKDKILKVNSYHDYCIKDLPKNFIKVSNTKDGSIEIAEHKSKKILCLMFHPERKMKSKKNILKSIKNFF
tara:strand:+ start:97 stop:708 length:612 start_codon:yes stop_codon:yes gene_type:complete